MFKNFKYFLHMGFWGFGVLVAKQDLIGTSEPHQKHFNLSTLSSKHS